MKYTIAFILSFLCGAAPAWALGADAWNTGFIIDFNEQWLRQDALNRALGQARKDMQGSSKPRRGGDPNFKTDVLYTGAQPVVQGEFLEDSAVRKLAVLMRESFHRKLSGTGLKDRLTLEDLQRMIPLSQERLHGT